MTTTRTRHQLFLPLDVSERLEALAAKPGASKSAILADALTAWLNRQAASELEEKFATRLNRMSNQLDRIERDSLVTIESLAMFIHYQLTVCPPVPESDTAMRAIGRDRFNGFIMQVGRQLASGKRSLGATPDAGAKS